MKTKNLGHTHMCVSHVNTTIERRRVSVSFGRSVDSTCMLPLFVCFFSRALPRNYTTSYIQYVPGSGRFKAVPVSPCNRRRVSQLANTDMKNFILDKAQKGSSLRSQQGICTVGTVGTCNLASNLHDKYPR